MEAPLVAVEGPLTFRAGFELSTRHLPFGGYSGLVVQGDRLLAISDHGLVWQSRLVTGTDGTLVGFTDSYLGPLRDPSGKVATPEMRFDAEELTPWEDGWLVSLEGEHRIFHYRSRSPFALSDPSPRRLRIPPEIADLPENGGLEAMVPLGDGRLAVFAEGPLGDSSATENGDDTLPIWVGDPLLGPGSEVPGWERLDLLATGAFRPTGAAALPGGDVLLLERSWNETDGVRVRLSSLRRSDFQPGAMLRPTELLRFEDPAAIDNFEAIYVAAGAGEGSPTMVYLLADDNFSDRQRTLLFQLELKRSIP